MIGSERLALTIVFQILISIKLRRKEYVSYISMEGRTWPTKKEEVWISAENPDKICELCLKKSISLFPLPHNENLKGQGGSWIFFP